MNIPLFVSLSAIIILSLGVFITRIQAKKLPAHLMAHAVKARTDIRKFYFLSIAPLVVMSYLVFSGADSRFLFQVPAASVLIDIFCTIKVREYLNKQHQGARLRFLLVPFFSLGISKLLFFLAFLLELNENTSRENAFSISYL